MLDALRLAFPISTEGKEGFGQSLWICAGNKLLVCFYYVFEYIYWVYIGFGDYLHTLDPSRTWEEHLSHVLVFCKTHLQRNFAKKFPRHPLKHGIHQLWEAGSKAELLYLMDCICKEYPELQSWVKNKKTDWILGGLSREQSKIPFKWWVCARKHTGLNEGSHFQDNNFTGRKISMLGAVLK